jgi:hypothetical protein
MSSLPAHRLVQSDALLQDEGQFPRSIHGKPGRRIVRAALEMDYISLGLRNGEAFDAQHLAEFRWFDARREFLFDLDVPQQEVSVPVHEDDSTQRVDDNESYNEEPHVAVQSPHVIADRFSSILFHVVLPHYGIMELWNYGSNDRRK